MKAVSTYRFAAALFARALGIIYLIAFVSFALQATGLIGSGGILPIAEFLKATSWSQAPSVFRLADSDLALRVVSWAGAAIAAVAACAPSHGWLQRSAFALLFPLYLSLVTAGQIFMGYQWDYLLLECGFLAIFLTPHRGRVWLLQWLLFRLMFESGLVKLTSHDETWRNLTALSYHYQTQPLPTPLAWFMEQLPMWAQKASTAVVFLAELILPFLIFGPRKLKQIAAFGLAGLQLLILLTGNYTFFNWLAIALCLSLLDDRFFGEMTPNAMAPRSNRYVTIALITFVTLVGVAQLAELFSLPEPGFFERWEARLSAYGVMNSYGLFASMTTTRPEIQVEGSNDGTNWKPYVFRYKAGPLNRAPSWVAPFQPRLDWQMWFAALGNYPENPWFGNFLLRVLQGSPPVMRLLATDPFAGKPPKYIRATEYEYRFTDWGELRKTGDWWKREPRGNYFPAVSLR